MATRVSELIARLNDQVSAQARTVAENLNKVSTSGKDVQSAMDGVDGSMKRTAQTTDQFVRSADGVQKATNRIEAAFDRTAMRLERATEDYRKGAITLQQYRDIQATLATQYENIETREQKTIDALRRKGEALAQVTGATHDASEATDAASAGLDNLTAAQGKNTATVKLQSYQIAQIADEFHKWVDQVLSGGSAITATTYQLPNMVQAMGGLGNATKLVGGLLSGPAGLGLAATIAGVAIYKLGSYAEGEQEHMAQLSQHLRATRTDYADLAATAEHAARSLHGGSDLSLADSRTIIQTIVSVPTVDNTQLQRLTHDAQDLATVMGTTVPDAAKTLASSMQDPSKAAQQFSEESLTGFDAALVQSVQHMQQMGDRAGATDLVLRTLEQTVHGATDNALTPFQAAWRKLEDEFGVVHDVATTKAQGIGDVIVGMATTSIGAITDLVEEIRKIPGAMETAWGAVKSGAGWAYGKLESGVEALVPQELADSMRRGNAPDPVFASPAGRASSSGSDSWNFRQASSMVDTVAAEQALGSDLTSLMHLIQSAESSTGQYHNGQLVTSGAGAIGAMQVMPSNAGGYDITDLHGNESASAKYLKQLYAKYDGDQTLVAMAYNWGPGNVDRWLAQGSNPDTIPQETQDYIARTTEGRVYGSVAAAGLRQSSDAYVSKGDPGTAGQLADLQRTYAGESQALSDLNRQFQAGLIGQQAYETGAKDLHAQMDATSASIANTRDPLQELSHSLDLSAQSAAGLTGYQREMISVAQQVEQAQLSMNGAHASASSVLAAQTQAQARLGNEWTASVTALSRQADEQDSVNASYAETAQSLDHVTNYQKAYEAALNSFDQKSPDFSKHVDDMTAALDRQTAAQKEQQLIGQIWSNNDQLAILQAETASLGQNDDARQAMIAHMQAEQTLLRNGESLTDRTSQAYLASADAVTQASVAYEHQQQTLSDLTGSISNMADQLSDGLVQGFLQGTSSGMSFKSTLQAIETQIASMILKMGLINPLLNDIDGGTRDTLSDISKLLGNLGGSSGSSSGDGWVSTGGAMDFEGSGISVGQELNLKNSLSSPASATSGSWLQSALGTKVIGSASIGNMLAGLGGGMAVGGLVGSLTGGGSGSMIGGSIGSLVGSVGGSFLGPIGSMVGGAVLGGIGSLIGSLFSKSHYAYDSVSGQGGQLVISDRRVKRSDDDVSGSLQSALDAINAVYGYTGVSVDDGFVGDVGHYKKGKNSNSQTLEQHLGDAHLTSSDATMQMALDQLTPSSFDSVSSYTQAIQSLKTLSDTLDSMGVVVGRFDDSSHLTVAHFTGYTGDMATALSTLDGQTISLDDLQSKFQAIEEFVGTTMPGLLDVTASGSESLTQQVEDLQKKYQDAANTAASYGLSAQALLDRGNAIAATMIANETTTLNQNDQAVQARYLAASGDQQGADLLNFDVSAAQQVKQLQDNWDGYLGDTYASNVTYQAQMADLDRTLAAERLQIQEQYAGTSLAQQKEYLSQADQSVAGVFSNLSDYASGLMTSDASPLSVQDQYAAANDNLHSDYQAALGGDYDALSRVQSDMQDYLTEAKAWFGSGTGYADAVKQVSAMLAAIGAVGSDTYTASLAKQLAQQNVDATLAVKQSVDNLNSNVAQLRRLITVGGVKAA